MGVLIVKRRELQAPVLPVFQARARLKLSLITMPEFCRQAIAKAISEIMLPLREVAKVSKQEAWHKFTNRLLSACRAEMPANSETERILKEYRVTLNQ